MVVTTQEAMQRRARIAELQEPILRPGPQAPTSHVVGIVHVLPEQETWNSDAEIPKYAVERGMDITDHVQEKARQLTLTGFIFNDETSTAAEKVRQLEEYKNTGILVPYYGRHRGINFLVHKFMYQAEHTVANGFKCTIILEQVRFAEKAAVPQQQSLNTKTTAGKKQTSGTSNNEATTHIVKSGDTYIELAKKYGTTWQELQKLNGYPPTKIPVGAELKLR